MSTKEQHQIPQEAFDWYDEYAHGLIDRRTFMTRLATLTVVGLSMSMLTSALLPNYALAEQVNFNDPDILATYQTFPSPLGHGECQGYWVSPKNVTKPCPTVLVVHENRGLNPYVKDVARRVAKAGFNAFAPDALYPLGGYPGNDDQGRSMQRSMDRTKLEQDFIAAADYARKNAGSNGKLGAVGFCFGGYIVNMLAARLGSNLTAGVPFYGTPAAADLHGGIQAPLMIQLGELDKRVNATWPDYETSLKNNNVPYVMHMYPKANHGFHNDSTSRYDPEAAELAWQRSIEFFKQHLG